MARPKREIPQIDPLSPEIRTRVLQTVEDFHQLVTHETGVKWTNTALLAAAGMDHRFLYRIRTEKSFTVGKVDALIEVMNKALRGEIHPDDFKAENGRNAA